MTKPNILPQEINDSLWQATQSIKEIIFMCRDIVESGDKAQLGKLHNIMDYYQNQIEIIFWGDTLKNIKAKITERMKKNV